MKRISSFLGCAATVVALSACSGSPSSGDIFSLSEANTGKTVVTVNGTEIHEGLLTLLSALSPRLKAQLDNPITRKKILTSLVEQELLYQEAIKRGVDKDKDVQTKKLLNEHTIISNTLLEKELDGAMQKAYDERKATQFTQVSISQIAVNFLSEEQSKKGAKASDDDKNKALEKAKAIKARLDKGEDFAAVAKEASDDKRTATKGGAAGEVSKDDKRYARLQLKNVSEEAFKLKKDQVSDPIETAMAYYIVKVTSEPKVTSFEDAKRVLGFELQATVKDKLMADLKKDAKIVYPDAAMAEKKDETKPAPKADAKKPDAAPEKPATPAPTATTAPKNVP